MLNDEWLDLPVIVAAELSQLRQEGVDVGELEERFASYRDLEGAERLYALDGLYRHLSPLVEAAQASPDEPSTLAEIQRVRRSPEWRHAVPTNRVLTDRIAGAWAGRCAGCILGKPV